MKVGPSYKKSLSFYIQLLQIFAYILVCFQQAGFPKYYKGGQIGRDKKFVGGLWLTQIKYLENPFLYVQHIFFIKLFVLQFA